LLRALHMRGPNQFGGPSKLCSRSGRRNLRNRFAAPHQRPRVRFKSRPRFHRNRFAGEHRLIQQHRPVRQTQIRRNNPSQGQLHQISHHKIRRRQRNPNVVPLHGSVQREPRLHGGKSRLCPPFLKESQSRIGAQRTAMNAPSTYLPSANSRTITSSSIPGTGAHNWATALASGCRAVSGIAFGPDFAKRWLASPLVRPAGLEVAATIYCLPGLAFRSALSESIARCAAASCCRS
jgi:hypothetical protein